LLAWLGIEPTNLDLVMRPDQKFWTQIRSGQFFVARVGLGGKTSFRLLPFLLLSFRLRSRQNGNNDMGEVAPQG